MLHESSSLLVFRVTPKCDGCGVSFISEPGPRGILAKMCPWAVMHLCHPCSVEYHTFRRQSNSKRAL